jgi:exodeoxyribonuclease VIII
MSAILDLPHGLHRGVPESVYHERVFGLVSKSALDLVAKSPAHLKEWWDGAAEEPTAAMRFGTALHCAALTPDIFAATYAVEPDFGDCRTKGPKAERDAWRAEHVGRTIIAEGDAKAIRRMVEKLRAHPLVGHLMAEGDAELTMRWRDVETGLECKGRIDLYVPRKRLALDLKTTTDARPEAFLRSVANYRYDVQDAMYTNGMAACGAPIDHFLFVGMEKTAPFELSVIALDAEWRSDGANECERDMLRVQSCIASGEFPGYDHKITTLSKPGWKK